MPFRGGPRSFLSFSETHGENNLKMVKILKSSSMLSSLQLHTHTRTREQIKWEQRRLAMELTNGSYSMSTHVIQSEFLISNECEQTHCCAVIYTNEHVVCRTAIVQPKEGTRNGRLDGLTVAVNKK